MNEEKMLNKICMITGANSGIGKATAKALAKKYAYIILVCRNEEKAEQAREEIIRETGNTGIEILLADLSYQYEIREIAERFTNRFGQLDVLINNAGFIPSKREETIDGIEKTLAVNHLAPFLLTNLLLDSLKAATDGRVINVASEAHRAGARIFDLDNIQLQKGFSPMKAYGLSKLCNIMFTHELNKRMKNSTVTTYALHPGVVRTNLTSDAGWILKFLYLIGTPFMRSPEAGAKTSVYLATEEEIEEKSGNYFKNKKEASPAPIAFDDTKTEALWKRSEALTDLANR